MRKKIKNYFQRIAVIQQYALFEHKLGIYSLRQPEGRRQTYFLKHYICILVFEIQRHLCARTSTTVLGGDVAPMKDDLFGLQRHLCARISTTVLWGNIIPKKDYLFWAPLGAPRFSLFSCKFAIKAYESFIFISLVYSITPSKGTLPF